MADFKYMSHAEYQQLLQVMEQMNYQQQEDYLKAVVQLRGWGSSGSQPTGSKYQKPSQEDSGGEKKLNNSSSPSETKQEEWSVCKPVTSVLIGQVKPSTLTTEAVKKPSKDTAQKNPSVINWF